MSQSQEIQRGATRINPKKEREGGVRVREGGREKGVRKGRGREGMERKKWEGKESNSKAKRISKQIKNSPLPTTSRHITFNIQKMNDIENNLERKQGGNQPYLWKETQEPHPTLP